MSGGAIVAHFQFFVVLAFLTLYQAWLPFLVALAYVVLEHGVVGVVYPKAVYDSSVDTRQAWVLAAVHGGFVLAASFANILAWRLSEQESLHDGLTGLPNRTYFLDVLNKSLQGRGAESTAVFFIDLDNFKDANDSFGHERGDQLLTALATRLQSALRPGDFLARLGGDEFAVALTGLRDRSDARAAGERLLSTLSAPVTMGDLTLGCYASVGLAYCDGGDQSAADLLRNADLAMYESKRNGGAMVSEYRPHLHTLVLRRTELDAELRTALERDEFVVYYQPIFELSSGRMIGTEALLRWQHPSRGLLLPAEFIAAAEQSGVILDLGRWVLRTACVQTVEWQAHNAERSPMTVSVNLSPRQLTDRTLVRTVGEILHDTGLPPECLCLEITEGSVIRDIEATMPTLHALRALGVSLALDDFGTGYSSLSYLRDLPVNSVKIDRSFVNALDTSQTDSPIVSAIIELAHALGLTVTAEGAETPKQLSRLMDLQSDHAQGYLLGRPKASDALTKIIDSGPPAHVLLDALSSVTTSNNAAVTLGNAVSSIPNPRSDGVSE